MLFCPPQSCSLSCSPEDRAPAMPLSVIDLDGFAALGPAGDANWAANVDNTRTQEEVVLVWLRSQSPF
eukprot:4513318-Alexandrium_andersonii.AAC.1